ncbi:MAG: CheR family methyltransferase [Gemmataceae bacterium]
MNDFTRESEFEALLDYLKRNRGFDFTGYKRGSLQRRIERRMEAVKTDSPIAYADYLEVHPDEFALLFNTILINVTAFFRDEPAWNHFRTQIVSRILENRGPDEPIRVWSAGCASGEEAYSVAMVLAEALDMEPFQSRVKIYGTDVDSEALNLARQAVYDRRQTAAVPDELREKYFEKQGDRLIVRKELRRSVIFGRHDIIQDAPISRLDLLVCRNTLMYFNAETQNRILDRFHFALNPGGFLFLGKAEMLIASNSEFTPEEMKLRFFLKAPGSGGARDRSWMLARPNGEASVNPLLNHVRMRDAAFDSGPVPQIVVDTNGVLSLVNHQARTAFGLSTKELGRPLHDLELSYRPADLRSCIDQVLATAQPRELADIEWRKGPESLAYLNIRFVPLLTSTNELVGVSASFLDVTRHKVMEQELHRSNAELSAASEELQSTNEELETTNEELQSTIEELETTNEELQSTNEEQETMNEELQATNEELQAINEELRERSQELNTANTFLHSILTGVRDAVVVVDRDLHIQIWNQRAENMWGLRADEVLGKPFLNLDIGLSLEQLKQPIFACLNGQPRHTENLAVQAVNRRGRSIQCVITCTPMVGRRQTEASGVILLMEERMEDRAA